MHKNHLVGCGVGIALALVLVTLSGGSAGSLGVLVAALICPLAMVAAMWFLTGRPTSPTSQETHDSRESHDAHPVPPPREPAPR